MSGLAEILAAQGFAVSGSDLRDGTICDRLRTLGVVVHIGHKEGNVTPDCSAVVYSSAVSSDNPELLRAEALGIPIIRRAEVLAELMRLKFGIAVGGSHGKTTTTSMLAAILEAASLDPTIVIGGVVKGSASGGRLGKGEFLVAESDESDRSFLLLRPTIAVVTNIDAEHLSAYKSFSELTDCFETFLQSVPFYGFSVMCTDDPVLKQMRGRLRSKVIGYGVQEGSDLLLSDVSQSNGKSSFAVTHYGQALGMVELPMAGKHFALNAMAAIAVSLELKIPFSTIQKALAAFTGVGRRIELVSREHGITIVDDYGHHPTEITSTIQAVNDNWFKPGKRLFVAFQPHRYSRTEQCFSDFVDVLSGLDHLLLLPIYTAGEEVVPGVSSEVLFEAINERRHSNGIAQLASSALCPDLQSAKGVLVETLKEGDCVLCLGAGSISSLASEIRQALLHKNNSLLASLSESTSHLDEREGLSW
jgi:UDP-N-acetylmuramate--alanine ligase